MLITDVNKLRELDQANTGMTAIHMQMGNYCKGKPLTKGDMEYFFAPDETIRQFFPNGDEEYDMFLLPEYSKSRTHYKSSTPR